MTEPDYQLHADYDRTGAASGRSREYDARHASPGAIVVPNLDVDRRRLPRTVAASGRPILDVERPIKYRRDEEPLPLRIRTIRASAPTGSDFFLRLVGRPMLHLSFHDARGNTLRHVAGDQSRVPISPPPPGTDLRLRLEHGSLAGSPFGHVTGLSTSYAEDHADDARFQVEVVSEDVQGRETVHDAGNFTVAPAILLDNSARAVRLYVCESADNEPSVRELEAAMRSVPGVRLVKVPIGETGGDTWLQDQFQHALVGGPDKWRHVVIHLPRMASKTLNASQHNLARVVESHFPSRDIGLFDDLWDRDLQFTDANGRRRRLSFRETFEVQDDMGLVSRLHRDLVAEIEDHDPSFRPADEPTWSEMRAALRPLSRRLLRLLRAAVRSGDRPREQLESMERAIRARLREVDTAARHDTSANVTHVRVRGGTVPLGTTLADRLWVRLWQLHNSGNYGGNFEASPPTPQAPLGKIVLGRTTVHGVDFVDPDVYRVFLKQNKQPLVELNTSWLQVGHVDELVAFCPDRGGGRSPFAILRSSSGLAIRLVQVAYERYQAGLPARHMHLDRDLTATFPRNTTHGTTPVTRMFRGKVWMHRERRRPSGGPRPALVLPPAIYREVVRRRGDFGDLRYVPGEGNDRVYAADATVREVTVAERDTDGVSTNTFIEEHFLAPTHDSLVEAFEGARILPLPVLFDRVAKTGRWARDVYEHATGAYSPLVVNMQVLGGRLLVPRPYGPRMRIDDARGVLETVARELELPDRFVGRLTDRFIRRRRLSTGVYWIHRQDLSLHFHDGRSLLLLRDLRSRDDVVQLFADSFPRASPTVLQRAIVRPNRRNFRANGAIRDGWRRYVVDDGMLDLFETWIELTAAEVRAPISWVDSWHYHLHMGGIHCGTNVLRVPRRGQHPDPWDVADVRSWGERTFEFEPLRL